MYLNGQNENSRLDSLLSPAWRRTFSNTEIGVGERVPDSILIEKMTRQPHISSLFLKKDMTDDEQCIVHIHFIYFC